MDDLSVVKGGRVGRERLRREAEAIAGSPADVHKGNKANHGE